MVLFSVAADADAAAAAAAAAASSFNSHSLVAGGMRMTNTPGLSPDVSTALPVAGRGDASSTLWRAARICCAMALESGGALADGCVVKMPLMAEDTGASLLLLGEAEDAGICVDDTPPSSACQCFCCCCI